MMYILEGVDHVGKDTLIRLIKNRRRNLGLRDIPMFDGFNVYDKHLTNGLKSHLAHPQEWQKALAYETVNIFTQTKYDVVVNRFTWSELVYGNVFRGGADWSFYFDVMEKKLQHIAKIIYVTAPYEEIKKRIAQSNRNKTQRLVHEIPKLMEEYEKLYEKSSLDRITISSGDWWTDSYESLDPIISKIFGDL